MKDFAIIPKILPARDKIDYEQKIPKIIWQTMKTGNVPALMKNYADTWINLNPEYEYRFYDDRDVFDFIQNNFIDFLEGYKKIKYGASKADLWRYLVIYKYGGVYADMDCRCIRPLREWIMPNALYVSQIGVNKDLCQWLIISAPKNPIFLKAAQKTLQNAKTNTSHASYFGFQFIKNELSVIENGSLLEFNHKILALSGPPVLQQAAEECLREGSMQAMFLFTQIVCTSKEVSCQMNNNVRHETGKSDYRKALKKLNTFHYDKLLPIRIKRLYNLIKKRIPISTSK
jgi:mannosyltransferase OCH1-like enzyme